MKEYSLLSDLISKVDPAESLFLDLNMEIAEQIFNMMESQNLNQSSLAKKLGVNRALISKILKARENLTLKSLCKISIALNANLTISFTR